jgi:hypothetical protein
VAHGLLSGDVITISGTTDYNGTFAITKIDADNFYVTETFVDTQTGTISKKSTSFAFAVTTQGVSGTALTPAFKTLVDDIKVVKREGNTITLNKSLASLKDYSAMAVAAGSSWSTSNFDKYDETLMPFILIGPKKYWLTLQIMPKDSDNNLLPTRQYHSALMFSAAPTDTGTTYNEIDFTEANYAKKWDLKPTEKGSALDLSQDYGFGAFKPDEGSGGFVNTFQPFESATPPTGNGRFNLIDLSPVIEANKIEAEDLLTFMISPSNEDTGHELTVATSEYTTNTNYRPNFLTVFTDEMPLPPENFKVLPFEDNPFYPEFTWQAKDKDLWYGFLMIDNENIYNQYHKAVIYYPLNEVGIHNIAATAPVEKISALATTISGPLYDVEGLTGYALNFDGNDDYVECNTGHGNDPTSLCTTEMSVVLHIIPDSASDTRYLISQNIYDENNGDSYGTDKFYLRLNSSNQIEAMVSFSTTEFVSLTSSSILPTDGEIPTNIILTADTTLKSGNVKLFVNGKLEDQSGLSTTAGGTNNWKKNTPIYGGNSVIRFGNHLLYDTAGYDGKMEEIVIYKKCIYPLNPSEGRFLFTKPMEELGTSSIASSKSYTAKLFIKDYHNIRGKINTEVSSSSQISWRKAAFALDTS